MLPGGLEVGEVVKRRGYFTQAKFLAGRSTRAVERAVGYREGRLEAGWYMLFLEQLPSKDDFEVRGMSYMSGGVVQGHLPAPRDPRNAEQRLRDEGYDLVAIKSNLVNGTFTLQGADRLAKVAPVSDAFGENVYPPGSGIPQWTLLAELMFRVAGFVGRGQSYKGGYT